MRISSYHNWISPIHKVVEPQGEAKSDWEIMGLLARALDIRDEFLGKGKSRLMRDLARPVLESGTSYEALRGQPVFRPGIGPVAFPDRKFSMPSGKFEFLTELPDPDLEAFGFPFHLLTPKTPRAHNSQFHEERGHEPLTVYIHPDSAWAQGLRAGDEVWVVGKPGHLRCVTALDPSLREDVVVIHQGGWLRHNRNVNLLIEDQATSDGLGPAYYDARVRLEAVAPQAEDVPSVVGLR